MRSSNDGSGGRSVALVPKRREVSVVTLGFLNIRRRDEAAMSVKSVKGAGGSHDQPLDVVEVG
jgi:hypothetical protein